jgi:hypothetical protein
MYTFSMFKKIGPKLEMIKLMVGLNLYFQFLLINHFYFKMIDLCYFIVILIIIIIAFGVFFQSLMYHNQKLEWSLLETVFFSAFLVIAGENEISSTMLNS